MSKIRFVLLIIALVVLVFSKPLFADQYLSYQDLIELGKAAIDQGNYQKATLYFQLAQVSDPNGPEPRYYLNLIKRIREGRVAIVEIREGMTYPESYPPGERPAPPLPKIIAPTKQSLPKIEEIVVSPIRVIPPPKKETVSKLQVINQAMDQYDTRIKIGKKEVALERPQLVQPTPSSSTSAQMISKASSTAQTKVATDRKSVV